MSDDLVNRLIRYPGAIRMRFRIAYWRMLGMQIGRPCWMRRIRVDRNPWDISLGNSVGLDSDVVLLTNGERVPDPRIRIGHHVYINRFTMLDASQSIVVSDHTMIGPYVYITDHDHARDATQSLGSQPLVGAPVVIGRNVWIGAGATILKGVSIGDGAVVGAGAVVTRSVAAGTVVVGVPASPARPARSSPDSVDND